MDERVEAKEEIVRQRVALHRYLDRRGWPLDQEVGLMLDTLNSWSTNT